MEGLSKPSARFSLNHIFFDSLLDRLSEFSLALEPVRSQRPSIAPNNQVFLGKIYTQFYPTVETVEAMLVSNNKVVILGSHHDVQRYVARLDINVRYQYLGEEQVLCPGFIEPNMNLVISAMLQQWSHIGPFGFDCGWQKLMPNYGLNYIARALLYLDKGLKPKDWLLGYGLYSVLLDESAQTSQHNVYELIQQVCIDRPVAILDATSAIAYVNDSALEAIYAYLENHAANPFSSKAIFFDLVRRQNGLLNEQLVWLVEALPEDQLRRQLMNMFAQIDSLIERARSSGITHIGTIDSHPFARKVLTQYQQTNPAINLVEPKHSWLQELNSLACLSTHHQAVQPAANRSIAINIGEVGYCGYDWVKSYHGQSMLQPCQQLMEQGYNVCLQSGFPVLPLSPLRAAEQACSRMMEYAPGCYTRDERVLLPDQCLSKPQSLNAITKAAADHLGFNLGILKEGDTANFVHLSADPLAKSSNFRELAVVACYAHQ
ncbi:amidohydrolase family protein [Pseudoalteromonas byunsanensis]|uniref:amidohydrolase family protein n=1 Tax=Pseudoalteromonas byunsanensis TaxID=327939 RepID=UPI001586A4FF|nr:amidohydrolase family protein [Pseudoalteromonas byunsanensis]